MLTKAKYSTTTYKRILEFNLDGKMIDFRLAPNEAGTHLTDKSTQANYVIGLNINGLQCYVFGLKLSCPDNKGINETT